MMFFYNIGYVWSLNCHKSVYITSPLYLQSSGFEFGNCTEVNRTCVYLKATVSKHTGYIPNIKVVT